MSELKLISPLLDRFYMGDPISEHDGVHCCPAMEKLSEDKYIVKIISLPASQIQMDALLLSGAYADKTEALAYFESIARGIEEEYKTLQKLSQLEGFVAFDGCQVAAMEEDAGYNVYLLSPYRRTLERYMRKHPITHLEALNLGLDMCAALAICRRSGYLYVDLKPENIAMLQDKEFRIADLGFIKLDSLKYASLPDRYRSKYTAPEIADAFASLNETIDIYAAGLILYQVFNGGQIPALSEDEQLPPPAYADYEISEIILKACAKNPEDRWQDPVEMGQSLVAYMQRNGVHDVPIVAPAAQAAAEEDSVPSDPEDNDEQIVGLYEETAETQAEETESISEVEEQESEQTAAESDSEEQEGGTTEAEPEEAGFEEPQDTTLTYNEDEQGILSFLLPDSDDETAPENAVEDVVDVDVTPEVSEMLDQADDLIAHQTPDPVIPPEPIDVPIPPAIVLEEATEEPVTDDTDTPSQNSPEEESAATDNETADDSEETTESTGEESDGAEQEESPAEEPAQEESADPGDEEEPEAPKKPKHILRNILLTLLALLLIAAGYLFYKFYYLQPIDSIYLSNSEAGILTVTVNTEIPDDQLTVLCIDTYGNPLSSAVLNGKARFSGLAPNTAYTIKVNMKGFHKLTGETTINFTTPDLTKIVQFLALTGNEDGSVILNFTPDGTEPEEWVIHYTNDAGEDTECTFTGHIYTLTGLIVGKEYTFTLSATGDLRIAGATEVVHTASKIVKASNVRATGCYMNKLGVTWDVLEGTSVESWTVRCFNDSFEQTLTVDTTEVAFDIPDDGSAYAVEVTAAGMTVSERIDIPENSITVGVYEADTTNTGKITLSWTSSTDVPEGGWIVAYTINGAPAKEQIVESGNEVTISPLVPGSKYEITLKTVAGNAVLGETYVFETEDVGEFKGYAVTASDMEFMMCARPSYSGWDRYDVSRSAYRTELSADEEGAYVIRLRTMYNSDSNEITALFVIRDEAGNVISAETTSSTWSRMWSGGYCELDIPYLPDTPGEYTISVYFNNALANENTFTIVN